MLCRGLFTPGHNDAASRIHDNVHGVALRPHAGGSSLVDSFAQVPAPVSILSAFVGSVHGSAIPKFVCLVFKLPPGE